MNNIIILSLVGLLLFTATSFALEPVSQDPYVGAVVLDADSGELIWSDHADTRGYPASMVKMMDLLIILEQAEQGLLQLTDIVSVTAEAAKMGGSQVYLAEGEMFSIDELLYALVIQSANDAATALAIHVAGSKAAFVEFMNKKARELGMKSTRFTSVHGLPPGKNQRPDMTTARDMALLARALTQYQQALLYTSTTEKGFRNDTFMMRTHNKLLRTYPGCDGLKTGYYRAAGYSIAATATKNGKRMIAVVLGSKDRNKRNQKAAEVLSRGFLTSEIVTP